MTDRRQSRKKAYRYIMAQSEKVHLSLNRWSDKITDDGRYISLHNLLELKEGLAAPSEQLVLAGKPK